MKFLLTTGALVYSLSAVQGRSLGEVVGEVTNNKDMDQETSWDMADVVEQVMHDQNIKEAFEHWKDTALFDKEEDKYLPGGHKDHHHQHHDDDSDCDSDSDWSESEDSDCDSDSDDDDSYGNVVVTRIDNSFVYIQPIVNENNIVISNVNSGNNDIESNNFRSWSGGHGNNMDMGMDWMEEMNSSDTEEMGRDSDDDCDDDDKKRPSKHDNHPGFDTPSWSPNLTPVELETPSYNCVSCLFDDDQENAPSPSETLSPVETPEPTDSEVTEEISEETEPTESETVELTEEFSEEEGSDSGSFNINDLPF